MRRHDVDELRTLITDYHAQGASPDAIAKLLGCSRSTVYKQLRAPAADRRARPRRLPAALTPSMRAELEQCCASDPFMSVDRALTILRGKRAAGLIDGKVPSRATLARAMRALRGEPEPTPTLPLDPYGDLGRPDYDIAIQSDLHSPLPEVALARAMLRETLRAIDALDEHDTRGIARLRGQIVQLLGSVARARRGLPVRDRAQDLIDSVQEMLANAETEATHGRAHPTNHGWDN